MKKSKPIETEIKYCPTCDKKTEVYQGICQECLMEITGKYK